jgi:hypothetical protein
LRESFNFDIAFFTACIIAVLFALIHPDVVASLKVAPTTMSIWTPIMASTSLWDGVLSGTSDEGGTHTALIWISLVGEILVAIGILLEIERPLNLKKILSFAADY